METNTRAMIEEALASLVKAGNLLEQAFLQTGVRSPYMGIAYKVDAATRDLQVALNQHSNEPHDD
jgi:hypothetical protein